MSLLNKKILISAKEIISNEMHWGKEEYKCYHPEGDYTRYCAIGAVWEAFRTTRGYTLTSSERNKMELEFDKLAKPFIPFGEVHVYNDAKDTVHKDVIDLFDKVIDSIKE